MDQNQKPSVCKLFIRSFSNQSNLSPALISSTSHNTRFCFDTRQIYFWIYAKGVLCANVVFCASFYIFKRSENLISGFIVKPLVERTLFFFPHFQHLEAPGHITIGDLSWDHHLFLVFYQPHTLALCTIGSRPEQLVLAARDVFPSVLMKMIVLFTGARHLK